MKIKHKAIVSWMLTIAMIFGVFNSILPLQVVEASTTPTVILKLGADEKQMEPMGYNLFLFSEVLPASEYNFQVKIDGELNEEKYTLHVGSDRRVTFIFDNDTKKVVTDIQEVANERKAVIAGTVQTEFGSESNWSIDAPQTTMKYLGEGIYILRGTLQAGTYAYKVAMGSWNENYGGGGTSGGGDIGFTLDTQKEVTFVFQDSTTPRKVTEWYDGKTAPAGPDWDIMDEKFYYDGDDLGATYSHGNAALKLWAPKASAVKVNFYDKKDATQLLGSLDLSKGDKGVWSVVATPGALGIQDLRGYYYQYEVTNNGVTKKVLDPYAKSMAEFRVSKTGETGPDGDDVGKAAIVDLSQTNPKGLAFANIKGYEKREDAIIWEAHVRDFTSDPSIEGDLNGARWGSYKAFIKKLDYIKSLGVTHVQLLPIMAWYFGDEAAMNERELEYSAKGNHYNWGYDPQSYFSPDGAYSENPKDPELRVKELKELIAAIHKAGMGVILDVVYTHSSKKEVLNDIVPNYYYFQDVNGNFVGDFGNNLATSHKMVEKLMLDSVKYWFTEYKIDGMRWDMMGDATYEAVQNAYNAAAAINPKALFLGEGWRTFKGAVSDPSLDGKGATQDWMDKTNDVGVFADEIRNEVKSGYPNEGEPSFITGAAKDIGVLLKNIKAQPGNTPADDPGDMVNYIEAHDNLTLHDIIAVAMKKDPSIPENELEIHKRIRLGNALILTSQGTAFIHAGQEYGRTKQWKGAGVPEDKFHELKDSQENVLGYFIHDSYDSSDAINMFDWKKAANAAEYPVSNKTREYTAGLIQLRKSTDAFRLGRKALVDTNVTLINAPEISAKDLVIGYKNQSTDGTGTYYVFVNADDKVRTLSLSEDITSGRVLVDNDEAGIKGVSEKSGFALTANSIQLQPLTTVVIKRDPVKNNKKLKDTSKCWTKCWTKK